MNKFNFAQVDAFTDKPFAGNPAAVFILEAPRPDEWYRQVAREMNLSETAFLVGEGDGFRLRWFTPAVEVDLCGHATLASAHVLWEEGRLSPGETARFHTRSGLLTAGRNGELIELNFPSRPALPAEEPVGLAEALGAKPGFVGRNVDDLLVLLDDEPTLRSLKPDFTALARVPARGVSVTAPSETRDFDFVSRFFAPNVGIDEDPVTGSSFTCLGPFWRDRLGKQRLRAFQASARGGEVAVRFEGDRVIIGGRAVTVVRGELIC